MSVEIKKGRGRPKKVSVAGAINQATGVPLAIPSVFDLSAGGDREAGSSSSSCSSSSKAKAASTKQQSRTVSTGPPDFEPPLSVVNRVLKESLPVNVLLTRDARSAFARAAGIFICYVTHCANDIANSSKRSTISAADVLNALKELDMEELEAPLQVCAQAW